MIYANIDFFMEQYPSTSVNYCCSNFGGIKFAENLVRSCNLAKFPIVFFGIDNQSSSHMSKYCDVVNYYEGVSHKLKITKNLKSTYSCWGTPEFNALNWPCWEIALDILSSGRSIIKLDTDIVVRQNFEKELLNQLDPISFDFLFQEDVCNLLCAGFCAIHHKSYSTIKQIFKEDFLSKQGYPNNCDQKILRSLVDKKIINVKLLSGDQYPSGKSFYDQHKKIKDHCKLIHFNWIPSGKKDKIKKMKDHNCWLS
jgi:hypothetical protein